ncbi:transporter substrate-binding domain-containing protein [Cryobacterium sp. Y82]|uniref:transporter substrate-binding domain-containing protein n=1 Tax=Cryobacterium sp. Y82 TaxID=2045017 RepID=UPI000CE4349F|nr:transporter substrate-binding domain-containing protein [Cryobacterium sp. Y82]
MKRIQIAITLCLALSVSLLAGCSAAVEPADPAVSTLMDQAIHDALPQNVQDAGELTVVTSGANPPWWVTTPGKTGEYTGAGAELMEAIAEVMGVDIKIATVPDISGAFAAISAERYAFGFFPYADSVGGPKERPGAEFVDVLQEVVPFLVEKGNPKNVTNMDELCDVTVAALANAATYRVAEAQAVKCQEQGKNLTVLSVASVPDGVLALRSGRTDAFFTGGASLFYAARESNGELEVVGDEFANGFAGQFMGALLPKDSELSDPLLASFQVLFDNGDYEKIMTKYGLDREIIEQPGINLYADWLAANPQ